MMATTTTTVILNNQYCETFVFDHFLDFDDVFSLSNDFICADDTRREIVEMLPSLEIDQYAKEDPPATALSNESDLANLLCRVCGAPAHGYNFDQVTCESCKAFFRRNALKHMADLKCRFSGTCVITVQTRRRCTHCRLKKCFDVKMRKEWIRTEHECELRRLQNLAKQAKKLNQSADNAQLPISFPIVVRRKQRLTTLTNKSTIQKLNSWNIVSFTRSLSDDHRTLINNISNAYQLGASQADGFRMNKCTPPASVIEYMNGESVAYESLIRFYKCIPDFKNLDLSDQILLIKCNMLTLIHINYILIRNFQENTLVGSCMTKWIGAEFHKKMSRTRHYFDRFMKHPLVLKLVLVVFLFSKNLSMPQGSSQLIDYKDTRKVYESQAFYTSLLWHYLTHLFGDEEAVRSMQVIVTQMIHFQTLMNAMEEMMQRDTVRHKCNQLMRSLFQFT